MRAARCRRRLKSSMAGFYEIGPRPTPGRQLAQVLVPELVQALGGNRHRRAQLLGEERDAQLLDHPAEFLEARLATAGDGVFLRTCLVLLPERHQRRRMLLVALDVRAVFLEAQGAAPEVARQVLETLPWGANEEARVDHAVADRLHFVRQFSERRAVGKRLRELLARFSDRRGVAQRPFGDRQQARLGALLLLLEGLRRARRLVLADEGTVD